MSNPGQENKTSGIEIILESSSITPATDVEGKGVLTVGTTPVLIDFTGVTRTINISADRDNQGHIYVGKSDVDSTGANAVATLPANGIYNDVYNDATNPLYVVASIADQVYTVGASLA